ncbi:alpha-amylase family glycosyl hydrolase [Gordonia rubripertincta]|uniref:Alpha-amylase family glycosyl hydrolase n=1 Tax=Gordonia rubripertincta TaxID=36822 RepID=A0ABT4N3J0_GORRU|nr:alpha-amylase family glycosyl hydrolase [Gordonia rubripertincta]MCZ4553525.1 alpha-amylase family glycosyl hydrolase [Gordonia rubripertincta]
MIANPFVYEINTWPWLHDVGERCGRDVGLGAVPGAEWDAIAATGCDAVWLMGVWRRSPAGIAIALSDDALVDTFGEALPDYTSEDVVGSPYAVRDYVVDDHLGGPAGLARAREELAQRGLALILDFVPNHVAADHPWVAAHPEVFIHGTEDELHQDPLSYLEVDGQVLANGKDPYFAAWTDVVQLNAFSPLLRTAAIDTLLQIASQCDGVRCDMAMLMMNDVFARTWGDRAGPRPRNEYWPTVIRAVRRAHPAFVFIAEAYWDLEAGLQDQGFDHCYDKGLYDKLVAQEGADPVRGLLADDRRYQSGLIRFLENHDEPRAAAVFDDDQQRVAAVTTFTTLGARLIHDGQLQGRTTRLPVQLGRYPHQPDDEELADFYRRLFAVLRDNTFRTGRWDLCETRGWPDNPTSQDLIAWTWTGTTGDEAKRSSTHSSRWLVVVNLSAETASAAVSVDWDDLRGKEFELVDGTRDLRFTRRGDDLRRGMFVELGPWLWHLLRIDPIDSASPEEHA